MPWGIRFRKGVSEKCEVTILGEDEGDPAVSLNS